MEQLWRTNEGHSQAVPDRLAAGRKSYPSTHNERQQNATLAEAVLDLQGGNAKDALARLEGLPASPVPFNAWVSTVRAQALLRLGQGEAAAQEYSNILAHRCLVLFPEDAKGAVLFPLSYLGLGRVCALAGDRGERGKPRSSSSTSGRMLTPTSASTGRPKPNTQNLDSVHHLRTLRCLHSPESIKVYVRFVGTPSTMTKLFWQPSVGRLDADMVVYRTSDSLLASKVALGGLYRHMPEQELKDKDACKEQCRTPQAPRTQDCHVIYSCHTAAG